MQTLPALSALNPSLLRGDDVDAPSTLWERGVQKFQPWRFEFKQAIENDGVGDLQHVVRIVVTGGVVSRQRDMLKALKAAFEPMFKDFTPTYLSGKLNTVCTDKSKSFLFWEFERKFEGKPPADRIPRSTVLPGGTPGEFFKRAFGESPVELAESLFEWAPAPGLIPSLVSDVWVLYRLGDVGEEELGMFDRIRRGAGLGECASRR